MPQNIITEDHIEEEVLRMLKEEGYEYIYAPNIAPAPEGNGERKRYSDVVLVDRLITALEKINPKVPKEAIEEAVKKVLRSQTQNLVSDNQQFHNLLVNGVDVEYRENGRIKGDKVWLFDFDNIKKNEFLAVNQFTIIENDNNRRPDILIFVNGLPLVIFELKNPADAEATVTNAFHQIETYKLQIPSLFRFNEMVIISDGLETHAGTITSGVERFTAWKTINSDKPKKPMTELEVLIKGMLNKETILDLIRNFIVFQKERDSKTNTTKISKKVAVYHQYNAVNKAVESTFEATKKDKRAGVVWHTQGSGKSLTMVFYSGKVILSKELENPTIVVLTDRNDLDDQLYGTFASCQDLLRQEPVQSENRDKLKDLLKVASGGIVFTTIQKFFPEEKGTKYPLLSNRKNIIVIADEAHRSQYDFIDGFAKNMRDALPNASFIGFTGTPIEKKDRSTPAVFGKYVDIYDIKQSIEDKTTVGLFYEGRLAKLDLKPEERLKIDPNFEEVTEGEEVESKEKLKSKWAKMEAVAGSENRIKRLANDIVNHFEQRSKIMEGKAMVVCMSRRICVDLHNEIVRLKPEWYNKDDDKGFMKVIMTGAPKDPLAWQEHVRNKKKRRELGDNFKDPENPIKIAIVRDMWLTGFDVPCLHTMYIDKPMRGHGLMQAIARVNRVFKDKTGGLVVDYIGIAYDLKKALSDYTASGGKGKPVLDQEKAVELMLSEYEVVSDIMHGFEYKSKIKKSLNDSLIIVPDAIEHILKQKEGKDRFLKHSKKLIECFALAVPNDKALAIKEEIGFFQVVKSKIMKITLGKAKQTEELDSAIRQIISKAVVSDRVIDIFESVGFKKPNIEILSEEFLAEVKNIPQKNLAFEALKKLLTEEIKLISRKNIVKGRSFAELLEKTIKQYTNRAIETARVVEELIDLAKTIKQDQEEGKKLGLNEDEIAFYDALEVNDSAVKVLGDETLRKIAREIFETIKKNVSIDWTIRESVQAQLRICVKKILRKYGYPPDMQESATKTVLKQAEVIAKDWAER
ncbi:MAG: type I restriction endonuclease subunit R [Nanoarchaeota archaeon]|nr:type I restriction endonuclease subunit R [Nanoarchaeota archaeon]